MRTQVRAKLFTREANIKYLKTNLSKKCMLKILKLQFFTIFSGSISTLLKPRKLWWNKPTFVFKPTKSPKFSDIFSKDPSEYLKFLVLQVYLFVTNSSLLKLIVRKLECVLIYMLNFE